MSRSVLMGYDRYREPLTLYKCYECATLTPTIPNVYGVSLCDRHQETNKNG